MGVERGIVRSCVALYMWNAMHQDARTEINLQGVNHKNENEKSLHTHTRCTNETGEYNLNTYFSTASIHTKPEGCSYPPCGVRRGMWLGCHEGGRRACIGCGRA